MKYYIFAIHPGNIKECFRRGLIAVKSRGKKVLKRIKPGEKFIIYGGYPEFKFFGHGIIESEYYFDDKEIIWPDEKKKKKNIYPHKVKVNFLKQNTEVDVRGKDILENLSFIKNKQKYGLYFLNTFFEIPKEDYLLLENKIRKFKKPTTIEEKMVFEEPVTKKGKILSKRFHRKIEKLLKDSGFTILESNYNKPGPDIVAEAEKKKVIVQCKQAEKKGADFPITIRSLIDEYSRKAQKENAEIAILALSGYTLPKEYSDEKTIEKVLKEDKVVIWADRIIDYYLKVTRATKNYTKYTMFVDWNIKEEFDEPIKVPAIRISQKSFDFFVFTISPELLLKSAYVARRLYSMEAYQRIIKFSRLTGTAKEEGIVDYLDNQEGIFPTNLVCAFESDVEFDEKDKTLKIPLEYGSIWIIDGQHRLFSFCHSKIVDKDQYNLICSGFNVKNLKTSQITPEEQAKLFVTINQTAKKVTTELLLDLYEMIGKEDRRVEVVKILSRTSLFESKIKTVGKSGTISLATFALTQPMEGLVSDMGDLSMWLGQSKGRKKISKEKCAKKLLEYFKIVAEVFPEWEKPDTYILSTDRGIRGLLRLCPDLLEYSNGLRDKTKAEKVFKVLRKNAELRIQKLKGLYYGEGGANALVKDWIIAIQSEITDFGPRPRIINSEKMSAGELNKAKEFIKKHLSQFSGEVTGVLMFIDETTPDYLRFIPEQCSIKIIITTVHGDVERCKRKLSSILGKHPEVYIRMIFQERDKNKHVCVFHGRWLASRENKIELENDLKNDAQNKKQIIEVKDKAHLDSDYRDFKDAWRASQETLAKIFGKGTKSEFFYP